MTDWFAIISIKNILLLLIGFLIGRFYKKIKKVIQIFTGDETPKATNELK
jgi:hypothetical protein